MKKKIVLLALGIASLIGLHIATTQAVGPGTPNYWCLSGRSLFPCSSSWSTVTGGTFTGTVTGNVIQTTPGALIVQTANGAAIVGNFAQSVNYPPYLINASSDLSLAGGSTSFCNAGGLIIVTSTATSSVTSNVNITFPSQAQISSSTCGPTTGAFADQYLFNDTTSTVTLIASSGDMFYFNPGSSYVIPAGGYQRETGQMVGGALGVPENFLFSFVSYSNNTSGQTQFIANAIGGYGNSISLGGLVNITGTNTTSTSLVVTSNQGANQNGRLAVFNQQNALDPQDAVLIISNASGSTPLNVQSFATGKGGIKIEQKTTAGDANAASLSIDGGSGGGGTSAQGIRVDATNGGTGGAGITVLNNGKQEFQVLSGSSSTASTTIKFGSANVATCLELEDSTGTTLWYLTITANAFLATTTKPAVCN